VITIQHVYYVLGAYLAWLAWQAARDRTNPRRATSAAFWLLLALLFLFGEHLPRAVVGGAVLVLTSLVGFGGVRSGRHTVDEAAERAGAERHGHRILIPVLLIPAITLVGVLLLSRVRFGEHFLFEPKQATLISLVLSCLVAVAAALLITREKLPAAVTEGRRLLEAIGWAALLPLLLAMLGGVLTQAGVGAALAGLVQSNIPVDSRWVAVVAYGAGMTGLTMVMGNAFAAFPVMTAGVGLPLLVKLHGADPAILGAIGMLTGYCGTLMTPMAANFNIVPVALLGLPDQHAVIKAQIPTAIPLFLANLVLMYFLAFP
jgi:uncharacterized membrane protein